MGFGDHNNIGNPLRSRSSAGRDGFGKLRQAYKESSPSEHPGNGPFMAQVLMSYPAEMGLPAGEFFDYNLGVNSSTQRMPWIICRVQELHSHIPNPFDYDENGSPKSRLMYWTALRKHKNIGICFPEDLDPNYPLPSPREWVSVTYTNSTTYSGARYRVLQTLRQPAVLRSRDLESPPTPGLLIQNPVETLGGPMQQPTFTEFIEAVSTEKYSSPFPEGVRYEMMRDWGAPHNGRPHNGLDLMVVAPNGGLGTPVLTIGRARIKSIKCVDSGDRFPNTSGVGSFRNALRDDSTVGKLVTGENYIQYAQLPEVSGVRRLPGSLRIHPSQGADLSSQSRRLRNLASYIARTREEDLLMNRDPSPTIASDGSISGFTGRKFYTQLPLMQNITPAVRKNPVCNANIGRYGGDKWGPSYGRVYYFTFGLGPGSTGTTVEYQLLDGPLQGESHIVRCMHLGAVNPALLQAWRDFQTINRTGNFAGLDVPAGTEIGLLGGQAVLDSPPHLHIDFGLGSTANQGRPFDPACFMELGDTEGYWCCTSRRNRDRDHLCRSQSAVRNCYGAFDASEC